MARIKIYDTATLAVKSKTMAPLVPFIPLISAAVGVGATVYTQKKSEDAADEAQKMANMRSQEALDLSVAKSQGDKERYASQSNQQENANIEAMRLEEESQDRMRDEQLRADDEAKRIAAANTGDVGYAAKFEPGQGGEGLDSAMDFLVPKVADETGLVGGNADVGLVGGNYNPLGFNV